MSHLDEREKQSDELLVLGAYKDPLKKVEDGFGYYGTISLTADNKYIQCHICGVLRKNLASHVKVHKINVVEYKKKYQLQRKTALVSEEFRQTCKQLMLDRREEWKKDGSLATFTKITQDSFVKEMEAKNWNRGKAIALELRNKRGTCPDQLLEKIRMVAAHYGKTPTINEFMEYHGQNRHVRSIQGMFGSWNNAVEKAGLKTDTHWTPEKGSKKSLVRFSPEELSERLYDYAKEIGRTPTQSDWRRGFLPSYATYIRHFGSIENARLQAGLVSTT